MLEMLKLRLLKQNLMEQRLSRAVVPETAKDALRDVKASAWKAMLVKRNLTRSVTRSATRNAQAIVILRNAHHAIRRTTARRTIARKVTARKVIAKARKAEKAVARRMADARVDVRISNVSF